MYTNTLHAQYAPDMHQKITVLGFFPMFVSQEHGVYIYYHEKKSTAGVELRTHTEKNITTITISAEGTFDSAKAQVFVRKLQKDNSITAQLLL